MAARRGPGLGPALVLALALLGPGRPLPGVRAALDLRELGELKYSLEILAEPVLAGQRQAGDVVTVTSKLKQRFECRLPPAALRRPPRAREEEEEEEEAQLYSGPGVAALLRPMAAAPCLLKTKDWWTYEFCYGKHVQQYHLEESEIKGDVLFLGYYQSAFDWDHETAKASRQHRLKRYHSQSYVNGSRCDLTGRAREAEVRFLCEEGAADYIARVDEPQSCSYVLTVHTARLCRHPFLRPPAGPAPQRLLCQPALSAAQYAQHVRARAAAAAERKVAEASWELEASEAKLRDTSDTETPAQPPDVATRGDSAARGDGAPGDAEVWERARQVSGEAGGRRDGAGAEEPAPNAAGGRVADPWKKIRFKVIRSPGDLLQFIQELRDGAKKAKEKASEEEEEEEEEVTKAPPAPPAPEGAREEEEEEEEEEENEEEDADLLGGFQRELGAEAKAETEEEFGNGVDKEEPEPEGLKGELDPNRAFKSLASTLTRLLDKLEEREEEEEEEGAGRKADPPPPASGGAPEPPDPREHPRLRQVESQVRELLAKEGLRAQGKIEIKIVAAAAGGGEEEEGRWLSEEDTKNLTEIIFTILIQDREEVQKERRRWQALEDNGRWVWGRRDPPQPPEELDY